MLMVMVVVVVVVGSADGFTVLSNSGTKECMKSTK